ncbi:MAG: zinc-binding dehydrogenase [Desulfarculaceae bacterium]|nr:zinc-binding dehydrogenase [Desulfarculaceae bacterium]MCF8074058.1 zinc-binding dehydrogenase [Desulfarculaceae bacterium]MCF8102104.1 zinc-binding dehydrogenase [Desulfarculaceae bacterium]MCF8117642.1 zinc-binding dehydrogenase [Desulfarculaceae bacterium]
MLAARFYEVGRPLALEEIPTPTPGPGEVLIRVRACGVCGSDIHIAYEGVTPTAFTPITLGHEPSGEVAELGPGVEGLALGDRVVACCFFVCGSCPNCLGGNQQVCLERRCIGIQAEGAMAEYLLVPAANLVPLPGQVPFSQGAIITDAVATPFHALTAVGKLRPGETVAVFGCGGLGIHGVQLARLGGAAKVIAVDIRPAVLERALASGADVAIDASRQEVAPAILEATNGLGVDLAVELVGAQVTIAQAVDCLRVGGRAAVAGLGPDPITLPPPTTFVRRENSLLGSYGFTTSEIGTLVDLVASGKLDLSGSISLTLPLTQVNQAMDMLHQKTGDPVRIVVEP